MTYNGPERRDHEPIVVTLAAVVAAELRPISARVDRLARLIEGENGGRTLNAGILGCITGLEATTAKLEVRVVGLERKWDRIRWSVGAFALGGGIGGGSLVAWISHLIGGGPL